MPKKILLVDDDKSLNLMLKIIFQKKKVDWQLESAHSGDEALQLIRTFQPDLAVLDMMMPGMDGFELAKRIQMEQPSSPCKLVFLSAVDDPKLRKKVLAAGIVDFWSKPIPIGTLESNLSRLLD